MKIKLKITLGVGLLFLLIILLSILSAVYINILNKDTQNILVDNYSTVDYSRSMIKTLDDDITKPENIKQFYDYLDKQKKNITEIGEKELTDKLLIDFEKLKLNPNDSNLYISIRADLTDIMLLNMQAIQRKSNIAKISAKTATIWIAFTGSLCFIIALILLVNLPGNIADPIKELTESFKQIAAKNYQERVYFYSKNEFGELADAFNVMAEKLEEYDNSKLSKILTEKKRIETLINNMHDPVIGLDENKTILFANEEAFKISGLKPDEIVGKNANEIAFSNDLIRHLMLDILPEGNTRNFSEKPLKIYADNKESYFDREIIDISITPTGEQISKHIGHVIILRNITAFKELDFAKTNFIATVSHEFKTPISSIKMSLQLFENEKTGKLNEEQKHLLESIKVDTSRLLKITGELLNMTQLESGNIQLSIIPSDPKEILAYAINANQTEADLKQIKFIINYPDDKIRVQADSEKTAWVLTNLISNAIRYSNENSMIIINVYVKNDKMNFEVKDYGLGIAAEYKDKVFDRYFRVPETKKEGSGLGLAISKEFIEAQGGNISVESKIGSGSTFIVSLNVAT
ncbi:MAG TPA: ATP-binding protein [Saprospiraceae bacterium]|nr:ATP-binding protein [Saprospiraceae bacterium]